MSDLSQIRINLDGLGHILKDNILSVPIFQRSYAWEEQNVSSFLKDILGAMHRGEKEYFFGSVVLKTIEERNFEVVDGQQRLATAAILIAGIRDFFHSKGGLELKRSQSIESSYLLTTNIKTMEEVGKLKLNETDHIFFEKVILSKPGESSRGAKSNKKSHENLRMASEIVKEFVNSISMQYQDSENRMIEILEYLDSSAKVIRVEVPDHANAFTIFETLNDRGVELAIADLLKNFLFHLAGDRIVEAQHSWVSMVSIIESLDNDRALIDFIRHYWSSKYGLTRERDLFNAIREKIKSKQAAIDFANDLRVNASFYSAIINPGSVEIEALGTSTREYLSTLKLLGMIQVRPLLLAILAHFKAKEVPKALRLLVSSAVRFTIVGGLGSGALESAYCEKALNVRGGRIENARKLREELLQVVPNDQEFKQKFAVATISKSPIARYLLRAIECYRFGKSDPELVPNPNEEHLNLEHVLPQNPSSAWGGISEDMAKAYYNRLGNMTLLRARINSTIGNKGFDAKMPFYNDSHLLSTKDIACYNTWKPEQVQDRQEKMADIAVKVWAFSI